MLSMLTYDNCPKWDEVYFVGDICDEGTFVNTKFIKGSTKMRTLGAFMSVLFKLMLIREI